MARSASSGTGDVDDACFGLALTVTLMVLAANLVARLVQRFKWIAWIGLLLILYVALSMIWEGAHQVGPVLSGWLRT